MRADPGAHVFIHCVFKLCANSRNRAKEYGVPDEISEEIEVCRDFDGRYLITFSADPSITASKLYKPQPPVADQDKEGEEPEEPEKGPSLYNMLKLYFPKFVYYSNYGNLASQIYLPHVVENMERDDLGAQEEAKVRTLKVLFDLVNLSAEEILELGEASSVTERINPQGHRVAVEPKTDEEIRENEELLRQRSALLASASTKLTRTFKEWWKQGDYRLRLDADGSYFRIWVSDGKRPEEIELENRSTGLQWFLSFYLVFTYESEDAHKNAIVLLDEPGHSLHPLAQRDLSSFFDSLSESNQLLFTTHSPFMIDADRLDRVRKVQVDDNGFTVASADLGRSQNARQRKQGAGATYAVYSAINLSVAESLLLGCAPVVVEGPSDQHYLSAIKSILISRGLINPRSELVFPPSGGAKTAKIIASILMGKDEVLPIVLLDGDDAGMQAAKSLKGSMYAHAAFRVLTTDDVLELEGSEIEDLMPPELLIQVLDRMERRADTDFEDFYESGKPIVPQVKAWAESEGFEMLPGWKVTLAIGIKEKLFASAADKLTDDQLSTWKILFEKFFQD